MDFFELNIQTLTQRYPSEAKALKNHLHSGQFKSPALVATSNLAQQGYPASRLCLFLGVGDGEFLMALHRSLKSQVYFCIVEHDLDVCVALFQKYDLTPLINDPQTSWFLFKPLAGLEHVFWDEYLAHEPTLLAAVKTCLFDCYMESDTPYYSEVKNKYKFALDSRKQNANMAPEDAYHGLMNTCRNLKLMSEVPLLDKLENAFKGKPALVIGTGPSLSENLDLIRQYQKHFVICSTDSALKLLLQNDIVPHFVACLERVPETVEHFKNMPEAKDSYLLVNPLLVPETMEAYKGPQCCLMRSQHLMKWLMPEASMHDLGICVSHMAYWAAHFMGCEPIVLLGQDLAFDRNSNQTHADGVADFVEYAGYLLLETARQADESEGNWVEGNNGQPILSNFWFQQFRLAFERLIWRSQKRCLNAINIDYGAKINYAEWVDPQKMFKEVAQGEFDALAQIRSQLTISWKVEDKLSETYARFQEAKDYLDQQVLPPVLEILHQISSFYLYHLPEATDDKLEKDYLQFFSEIEKQDQNIINARPDLYQAILDPFISKAKTDSSVAIASAFEKEAVFEHKVDPIVSQLHKYFQEVSVWAQRCSYLFAKVLNQPDR